VVGCWHGYLSGVRCRFAYGPADATASCFSEIQMVLPFWYRPTWVVPEKGPLNGCVCVCKEYHVIEVCSKAVSILCQVNPKDLDKESFWVKIHEDELASDDLFAELKQNFSSKPASSESTLFS